MTLLKFGGLISASHYQAACSAVLIRFASYHLILLLKEPHKRRRRQGLGWPSNTWDEDDDDEDIEKRHFNPLEDHPISSKLARKISERSFTSSRIQFTGEDPGFIKSENLNFSEGRTTAIPLCFFQLFFTLELFTNITEETNSYVKNLIN